MNLWTRVRSAWSSWSRRAAPSGPAQGREPHLERARASLQGLIDDPKVPATVRSALAPEFADVQAMLDKIELGHVHVGAFGRVGVGKSALLNALLNERRFATSPLHGETRAPQAAAWQEWDAGGVLLIDTPGIDDVEGEARERLAHEVARRSDLVLFVVDGDLSAIELEALEALGREPRPLVLVFNKVDRYTKTDRETVLDSLGRRTAGIIASERIVCTAAEPAERTYIQVDEAGGETEERRQPAPEVRALRQILWSILEAEGQTLVALNATLFAGKLSDAIGERIVAVKKDLAGRLIHSYCLAKGVVVGLNPVPISDLIAAGVVDVSLILHLSRIYGLPMTTAEAGGLLRTIAAQMALLMGTVWAVHLASSAIKGATAGLSTLITGATQGAVAYYSAYVVGQAAQSYFVHGRSWGPDGPKRVVQEILESLDEGSLLLKAREQIAAYLR